jgi:hypothetical protein
LSFFILSGKDEDVGTIDEVEVVGQEEENVIRFPISQSPPQQPAQDVMTEQTASPQKAPEPPVFSVTEKIPLLEESDETILSVLGRFLNLDAFGSLFQIESLVSRLVITVDNMTLRTLPPKQALVKPPKGKFMVIEKENYEYDLDPKNYQRYTPYVDFIEQVNIKDAVTVYVHFYPLFQEVYESLGYPDSYFNDRLIEVIDHLLQTPTIDDPIELKRPNVFYIYADRELEAMSAGQRTLVRMGSDNASRLKLVLITLRDEILARVKQN